jgi:hypothetical protein
MELFVGVPMNNLNNKFFWVVVALTATMLVVGIGGKVFVDRVADVVVERLKQKYSPSPYGPGVDPDKIDMDKIRKN